MILSRNTLLVSLRLLDVAISQLKFQQVDQINTIATDGQSVVLPEGVEKIGRSAFWGCSSLTIHSPKGSFALAYAEDKHIKVVAL